MNLVFYLLSFLLCFYSTESADKFVRRVNNGNVTSTINFEYVVFVKVVRLILIGHACTGGIIHEKVVLSAAHCITDEADKNPHGGIHYQYREHRIDVFANADSWKQLSKKGVVKRKVTDVYFVKKFFENGQDDIVILKLDHSLGESVRKLLLPKPTMSVFNNYAKEYAVFAGFGTDPGGTPESIGKLKKMVTRTVYFTICEKYLIKKIDSSIHLCTKAVEIFEKSGKTLHKKPKRPVGGCAGDSGGPLVQHGDTIIGVLSKGKTDCDARVHPDVYVKIPKYLSFIHDVIEERPIDKALYVHHSIKH